MGPALKLMAFLGAVCNFGFLFSFVSSCWGKPRLVGMLACEKHYSSGDCRRHSTLHACKVLHAYHADNLSCKYKQNCVQVLPTHASCAHCTGCVLHMHACSHSSTAC